MMLLDIYRCQSPIITIQHIAIIGVFYALYNYIICKQVSMVSHCIFLKYFTLGYYHMATSEVLQSPEGIGNLSYRWGLLWPLSLRNTIDLWVKILALIASILLIEVKQKFVDHSRSTQSIFTILFLLRRFYEKV